MTLEAALVMPVFLLAILFLVSLIQASIVAMALHGALSQSVRQAASQWYPISLGIDTARQSQVYQTAKPWEDKLQHVGQTLNQYGDWLPPPISDWAEQAAEGKWSVEQLAARHVFEALLDSMADKQVLDPSRWEVAAVELPESGDRGQALLRVEAEYRLPMQIPFVGRPIKLRESAAERVWIGGQPSTAKLEADDADSGELSFVSLTPNPVKRGSKATLTLRAKPGEAVDLTVIYKSGLSQAKHLGNAVADASGTVSWTWHVSGNTTPGEWTWEAQTASGAVLRQPFEVVAAKSQ